MAPGYCRFIIYVSYLLIYLSSKLLIVVSLFHIMSSSLLSFRSWRASSIWLPDFPGRLTRITKAITVTSTIAYLQKRPTFTDFIPMQKLGKKVLR